ncbi:MAG TPA: hypothetical protein VN667_00870, partial [Burkholderiales bacterium]|nr:hypothetical protein [Burkholderiales bacterium]
GNIAGVILGAVLLTGLPEFIRFTVVPAQQALFGKVIVDPEAIRMLVFGLALIVVMLVRPAGLWPSSIRKRELTTGANEASAEGSPAGSSAVSS